MRIAHPGKVALLAFTFLAGTAIAQQLAPWVDYGYRGVFSVAGGAFACTLPPGTTPKEDEDWTEQACLHMGPFAIGTEAAKLEVLGKPVHADRQPDDTVIKVYVFGTGETAPYLAATIADERIVALQTTGAAPIKDFDFNDIQLGDSEETLRERFGPARRVQPGPDKATKLWSYPPFTFTFHVRGGKVVSIRISDHEHL